MKTVQQKPWVKPIHTRIAWMIIIFSILLEVLVQQQQPTVKLINTSNGSSSEALTDISSSFQSSAAVESVSNTSPAAIKSECSNGVCVDSYVDPNGNTDIYSRGYGQSYSVHSRSYESTEGKNTVESWDSEDNSYKVESHCDSNGCYSSDSQGNTCQIMSDETVIGCK